MVALNSLFAALARFNARRLLNLPVKLLNLPADGYNEPRHLARALRRVNASLLKSVGVGARAKGNKRAICRTSERAVLGSALPAAYLCFEGN